MVSGLRLFSARSLLAGGRASWACFCSPEEDEDSGAGRWPGLRGWLEAPSQVEPATLPFPTAARGASVGSECPMVSWSPGDTPRSQLVVLLWGRVEGDTLRKWDGHSSLSGWGTAALCGQPWVCEFCISTQRPGHWGNVAVASSRQGVQGNVRPAGVHAGVHACGQPLTTRPTF